MTFVMLWILGSIVFYAVAVAFSVEGYEDDRGFHYGSAVV